MEIDLTSVVGHLFCHNSTYSDLDITRRITEDHNIRHLALTARFVKRIRLEQGWLRQHNDPAAAEMQEASIINTIEQLLAEGRIRLYGNTAVDNSSHTLFACMGIVLAVMMFS
jgi:hypothetical protein